MIKLQEHKELTEHRAIQKAALPSKVYIPLIQHFGKPCDTVLVKPNDVVKTGSMIATAEGGVFSPIHASVSGTVVSVGDYSHPFLGKAKAVVVASDGKDEKAFDSRIDAARVHAFSKEQIRTALFEAGIVGLGGAGFPTHIKMTPPRPIDTFILNGAECEPFLTTDFRLMCEHAREIIQGAEIVLKLLEPQTVFIAIEDNKKEAIDLLRSLAPASWKIKVLKTAYPQGGEKQVIASCLGKEVPSGKLPFDIGVVVSNVGTVYAIYEALYAHKPLYEKVVTVTGHCLTNPANLLVRIGTPMQDLVDQCGPLKCDPAKIVMGGPMMGIAQQDFSAPVVKGTSGILLLGKDDILPAKDDVCIRCGECIEQCPMGLMPTMLSQAVAKDRLDLAESYGVLDCIECGVCSFICPANRNIVQAIKYAKQRLRSKKQK